MYLFNRLLVTSGDMEAVMPAVHEVAAVMKHEAGVPFNVWVGGNGFVTGTIGFSVAYESLAARAQVTAKLSASKAWWAVFIYLRAVHRDLHIEAHSFPTRLPISCTRQYVLYTRFSFCYIGAYYV